MATYIDNEGYTVISKEGGGADIPLADTYVPEYTSEDNKVTKPIFNNGFKYPYQTPQEVEDTKRSLANGILEEERAIKEQDLLKDKNWIDASRIIYKLENGYDFEGSDEEAAAVGMDLLSEINYNLAAGTIPMAMKVQKGTDLEKIALRYAMEKYDQKDISFDGSMRFMKEAGLDVTNWLTVGSLGWGFAGKTAAKTAAVEGMKAATRLNMSKFLASPTAIAATDGALYGAADDIAHQKIELGTGAREEYNPLQTAAVSTASAAIAPALVWAMPYIGTAVKKTALMGAEHFDKIKMGQASSGNDLLDGLIRSDQLNFGMMMHDDWKKNTALYNTRRGEEPLKSDSVIDDLYNEFEAQKEMFPIAENLDSPIRPNEVYGGTLDLDTECKKTEMCNKLSAEVSKKMGRELNQPEKVEIIKTLAKNNEEYACPYCYIEDKRAIYDDAVSNFRNWLFDEGEAKITPAMKSPKNIAFKLKLKEIGFTADDFDSTILRDRIAVDRKIKEGGIQGEVYAWLAQKGTGSSRANKLKGYSEYKGELLEIPEEKIAEYNQAGGLRMFSATDFKKEHTFDIAKFIADADRRGLKLIAYTKQPEFVDAFGDTGIKINMSVDMLGGVDKNGKKIPIKEGDAGWDWKKAKEYRKKYPNAGTIAVALNDEQVKWALKQDWIDYVIPQHGKLSLADDTQIVNYAPVENPKNIVGKKDDGSNKLGGKSDVDWKMTTHNMDKEKFIEIMKEAGVQPQFSQFIDDPNYMKLITEYSRFDSPQKAVDSSKINFEKVREYMDDTASGKVAKEKRPKQEYIDDVLNKIRAKDFNSNENVPLPIYRKKGK